MLHFKEVRLLNFELDLAVCREKECIQVQENLVSLGTKRGTGFGILRRSGRSEWVISRNHSEYQ